MTPRKYLPECAPTDSQAGPSLIDDVPDKYNAQAHWCSVASNETVPLTSIRSFLKRLSELDTVVNTIVDQRTLQTLLHKIVLRSRNEEEGVADVKLLAELGANLESFDCEGRTALYFAARDGKHQILSTLTELGAKVDVQDFEGRSPLLHACREGNRNALELLISADADVNILDNQGRSPLAYVAFFSTYDPPGLLSLLLAAGADPNSDGQSILPLHAAAQLHPELCRPLLDAGADIHARGRGKVTAGVLQSACLSCTVWLSTISMLLEAGAEVNVRGSPEDTALQAAIRREHSHVVSLLIEHGADIHMNFFDTQQAASLGVSDDTAITALSVAVTTGNQEIVEMLLDAGASVKCVSEEGRSLLDASLTNSLSSKLASTLIKKKVDVNQAGKDGRTPLHAAAMSEGDTFEKVELLLQSGADIYARCNLGRNALHYAATKDICSRDRDPRVIRLLLQADVDPTAADENGHRPLHLAARHGSVSLIDELVKISGTDLANCSDCTGQTPLHLASEMDKVGVIRKLLLAGANIHAKDHSGQTAMHLAAANGSENAVKYLIAHGASKKKRDKNGKTARQVAIASGHKWVIKAIDQEIPASPNVPLWLALGGLLIAWLYVIAFFVK